MAGPLAVPNPGRDVGRVRAAAKVRRDEFRHDAYLYVTWEHLVVRPREADGDGDPSLTVPLSDVTSATYEPTGWPVLAPSVRLTVRTDETSHEFRLVPTLDPPSLRSAGEFRVAPLASDVLDAVLDGADLREESATWLPTRLGVALVDAVLVAVGLVLTVAGVLLTVTVVYSPVSLLCWALGVPVLYLGARDWAAGRRRCEWRRDATGPERTVERPFP